jgi:hypothetical protein
MNFGAKLPVMTGWFLRGNVHEKQFSVWWLKKKSLCAAFIINRSDEERELAPRWILRHSRLDSNALEKTRNLKSLDTTFGCRD